MEPTLHKIVEVMKMDKDVKDILNKLAEIDERHNERLELLEDYIMSQPQQQQTPPVIINQGGLSAADWDLGLSLALLGAAIHSTKK